MMKRTFLTGLTMVLLSASLAAQFREPFKAETPVSSLFNTPSLSGLIDPSKLQMRHSYSLSYSSLGGRGISLGQYVNSMRYDLTDNLDLQTDVSVTHSPFGTFNQELTNALTGINLSRVALNYRPTDNTFISFQFRQVPYSSYLGGYGGYGYGYNRHRSYDFFDRYDNDWGWR